MACENPGDTIFDVEMLDGSRKIRHTFRAENGKDMTRPDDSGGKDWKPFEYEMLNDSVMLFTFDGCDTRGFDRFVRKMFAEAKRTGVRHLIIDVRSNGGGNSATGDEVCRYLTDRPFAGFGGSKVKISRPVCEHYKEKFERDTIYDNTVEDEYELCLPYDRAFRVDGKTYLLTSVNTYSSACEFRVGILEIRARNGNRRGDRRCQYLHWRRDKVHSPQHGLFRDAPLEDILPLWR